MAALRPVPHAVRRGALTALLVLTAVFAVVVGEGGPVPARLPVSLAAEAAMGGGGGFGGEGQPSDAVDSEVRGAGESARDARRARARSDGRGRAAGAVASYRRTPNGTRHPQQARPCGVPVDAPLARSVRRWVVLRC